MSHAKPFVAAQIQTLMRAIDKIEESIGVNFLEKIDLMLQPLRQDVGQIRSQIEILRCVCLCACLCAVSRGTIERYLRCELY